jgi:SAM-dependent methyltransferase
MTSGVADVARRAVERIAPAALRPLLTAYLQGELAPGVTLLRALLSGIGPEQLGTLVDELAVVLESGAPVEIARRGRVLAQAIADNREGCAAIAEIHRIGGPAVAGCDPEARIAAWAALFDRYARQGESVSVAGYTLGNDALLAQSTAEVVRLLASWGVIAAERDILQIGCGIGRFEAALASRVRRACGIDISREMIRRARARCAELPNVHLAVASGTDLRAFRDAEFDLVYAVDSLPYIHESGRELLDRAFAEARRVLRPRGHLAVFNLRYGVSLAAERSDVERLAERHRFTVIVNGVTPFSSWDGSAYLLTVGAQSLLRE